MTAVNYFLRIFILLKYFISCVIHNSVMYNNKIKSSKSESKYLGFI